MLAGGLLPPVQDRLGIVAEPVGALGVRPDADLVQPAAEVGRRADVRADGDDAGGGLRGGTGQVEQHPAEGLLGGAGAGRRGAAEVGRHGGRLPLAELRAAQALGDGGAQRGLRRVTGEGGPRVVRVGSQPDGEFPDLVGGQQRGVVLRVPLGGQPVALDGVGEDHRRAGVVDGVVGVEQRAEVVTAEVAQRGQQRGVVQRGDEAGDRSGRRAAAGQTLTQLGGGAAQQPLVLRVAHGVDAGAQALPAGTGEQLLQQMAVLDGEDLPAGGGEHALQPAGRHARHHPVQGLPVEVDDPDHLAQAGDHRVLDCLPDRALVQFGVAEQRVLPSGAGVAEARDIAAGDRAPHRGGGADADRTRRVVHRVGVLGAAGVALQTAEGPQRGQVGGVQLAEQVVDGVQHR